MRSSYIVFPFNGGGYGIWLDHALTYRDAVLEAERLNSERNGDSNERPSEFQFPKFNIP
jgi:hypothetical protein